MTDLFKLLLGILASRFKARAALEAENLVLRQRAVHSDPRKDGPGRTDWLHEIESDGYSLKFRTSVRRFHHA